MFDGQLYLHLWLHGWSRGFRTLWSYPHRLYDTSDTALRRVCLFPSMYTVVCICCNLKSIWDVFEGYIVNASIASYIFWMWLWLILRDFGLTNAGGRDGYSHLKNTRWNFIWSLAVTVYTVHSQRLFQQFGLTVSRWCGSNLRWIVEQCSQCLCIH